MIVVIACQRNETLGFRIFSYVLYKMAAMSLPSPEKTPVQLIRQRVDHFHSRNIQLGSHYAFFTLYLFMFYHHVFSILYNNSEG